MANVGLILGIDTGGTYTDGVIINNEDTKQILAKSKALTTREDLTVGIRHCLDNLAPSFLQAVSMVSLSTTLATNTIVEGRGCEIGLILIGHEPIGKLPAEQIIVTPGGHDVKGRAKEELDLDDLRKKLETFRRTVEAVAISGYLSIRNPSHELEVRSLVQKTLSLPVVCAHELTTTLGFQERTVTAALNARLLPVIADLIESVKKVLTEKEIKAPLMIVKGDGSLMSEHVARERPIETILSGPASSIVGGNSLSPSPKALIVDIGGTTTDIALVENGIPRLTREGAVVGGWFTRIHSAEIHTYGLGGDSQLHLTRDKSITVGPQRVNPLSYIGTKYPYLIKELAQFSDLITDPSFAQSTECYLRLSTSKPKKQDEILTANRADNLTQNFTQNLSSFEKDILQLLESGPHSFFYLAKETGRDPLFFNFEFNPQRLINKGLIAAISLTPTDLLHARGSHIPWNREIALLGVELMARKMGKTSEEFLELASQTVIDQLSLALLESVHRYEGNSSNLKSIEPVSHLITKALHPAQEDLLQCKLQLSIPVIGIGAPAHAWLPQAAAQLNTPLIVPEHAEVANALGAAIGKIMVISEAIIRPGNEFGGFLLHAPWGYQRFEDLHEAIHRAETEAQENAAKEIQKAGAQHYELFPRREEIFVKTNYSPDHPLFVEYKISVTAIGSTYWT